MCSAAPQHTSLTPGHIVTAAGVQRRRKPTRRLDIHDKRPYRDPLHDEVHPKHHSRRGEPIAHRLRCFCMLPLFKIRIFSAAFPRENSDCSVNWRTTTSYLWDDMSEGKRRTRFQRFGHEQKVHNHCCCTTWENISQTLEERATPQGGEEEEQRAHVSGPGFQSKIT